VPPLTMLVGKEPNRRREKIRGRARFTNDEASPRGRKKKGIEKKEKGQRRTIPKPELVRAIEESANLPSGRDPVSQMKANCASRHRRGGEKPEK